MPDKPTPVAPVSEAAHRMSFFRQSGWLMVANIGGGALMWAVHFLAKLIPPGKEGEYGNFGFFLTVVMLLPTVPLQMVMAQQTARALATGQRGELSGVIRLFWWALSLIWLIGAAITLALQDAILTRWQISSPIGLYLTLPIILLSLWVPMVLGVLQGRQNFLWLGWSMMSNGICRFTVAAVAVVILHTYAAGMIGGVLAGVFLAFSIAAWHSRDLWLTKPTSFDWLNLLRHTLPLMLGFLGFQILFTADTLFVKAYFSEKEAAYYFGAGTLSRAVMWFVLPLAAVMFPRLVHSAAKSEKTNLVWLVFLGTGILAVLGAGALSFLAPWMLRFVYTENFLQVVSILPWYAFAMVPLALGNVLLNNLLARPNPQIFPSLCVLSVALIYMLALTRFHDSLVMVLKVLGICNLLLLGVCAFFEWRNKSAPTPLPRGS